MLTSPRWNCARPLLRKYFIKLPPRALLHLGVKPFGCYAALKARDTLVFAGRGTNVFLALVGMFS
jgi:hypothetical protein